MPKAEHRMGLPIQTRQFLLDEGASVMESKDERSAQMNRDRVQRHRDKQRQSGLVKVEVWVKPELKEQVIHFAKELR